MLNFCSLAAEEVHRLSCTCSRTRSWKRFPRAFKLLDGDCLSSLGVDWRQHVLDGSVATQVVFCEYLRRCRSQSHFDVDSFRSLIGQTLALKQGSSRIGRGWTKTFVLRKVSWILWNARWLLLALQRTRKSCWSCARSDEAFKLFGFMLRQCVTHNLLWSFLLERTPCESQLVASRLRCNSKYQAGVGCWCEVTR